MTHSIQLPVQRAIFLVGFMGAGKSSVGLELARLLNRRFIDLDERIETREGRKISDIFRDSGEPAFRRIEADTLRDLLQQPDCESLVVALGGGAFVQPGNARLIRQSGAVVVYLDASLDELRQRCAPTPQQRPLFQDEQQFRQLYEARRPHYLQADLRIETTGVLIEQVAGEVIRQLGYKPEVDAHGSH